MSAAYHTPVLLSEVIRWLDPKPGGTYIDCTVGGGAHAEGMLVRMQGRGCLLGIDRDPEAIEAAQERLAPYGEITRLRRAPFSHLSRLAGEEGVTAAHGILFDFGVSSAQIDLPRRGMSYRADGPLDLRMHADAGETAAELIARSDEAQIADILRRYGEERRARAIARSIAAAPEPPATTGELAALVRRAVPPPAEKSLSRVFQALRIAVNRELEQIESALPAALQLLAPGGRMVTISYHSLEDRLAKDFFRLESRACICPPRLPVCKCGHTPSVRVLTKKPVRPSPEEVQSNPRSRSARLRAAARLSPLHDDALVTEKP